MDDDLQSIRNRLGMSQVELADKLGVHQATISRIENGKGKTTVRRTILAALSLLPDEGAAL